MAALERIEVDAASVEEYTELAKEIAKREQAYSEQSSKEAFRTAVAECMHLLKQRSLPALISYLGQGYESTGKFGEVRVNPKNQFFREIVLQLDERRPNDENIRTAHFFPGRSVPLEWVQGEFGDLSGVSIDETGIRHYDVLRLLNERSGRLEFVAENPGTNGEEHITRISVWCW